MRIIECQMMVFFLLAMAGLPLIVNQSADKPAEILRSSGQLVIVTTPDWNAVNGHLLRFERNQSTGEWRKIGQTIPIVVGRNGLAWGRNGSDDWASLAKPGDPVKKEGDGRSPAGIFKLSSAFGYAVKEEAGKVKLPYVQATKTLECVDDPQSKNYNRVIERGSVSNPDWNSSEQMRRNDDQYRWGVIVDHNYARPDAGCGSCIFLHIWSAAGKGTAGCTAMAAAKMEELLFWLDPKKNPVIVQLPQSEFAHLQKSWQLPR